jgi:Flp pilus assembly pilin Flp
VIWGGPRDGFPRLPVNPHSPNAAKGANAPGGESVKRFLSQLWSDEQGQDIAEYAVMLAVILVIVVGTIRLIGSNANNVFSSVSSAIQ